MFKIKRVDYYADGSKIDIRILNGEYDTYESAFISMVREASAVRASIINDTDVDQSMFDIIDYECAYDRDSIVCHTMSVVRYDRPIDDRENDCDMRVVTGFDIIEA